MKSLLLTFLSIIFYINVGVSQSVEIPESGAIWHESHSFIFGIISKHYTICGDTIFNDTSYQKVMELKLDSSLQVFETNFIVGFRQEGEKSFIRYNNFHDRLLYDFTVEVGDTFSVFTFSFFKQKYLVDSTKLESIAGKLRKVIYFQGTNEVWIEGIGSNYGLLKRGQPGGFDSGSDLICFQHEDEFLDLPPYDCFIPELNGCEITSVSENNFNESLGIDLFPNPASQILFINKIDGLFNNSYDFYVVNSLGKSMKAEIENRGNGFQLEIANLLPGIYYLKAVNKENREIRFGKFIKQ